MRKIIYITSIFMLNNLIILSFRRTMTMILGLSRMTSSKMEVISPTNYPLVSWTLYMYNVYIQLVVKILTVHFMQRRLIERETERSTTFDQVIILHQALLMKEALFLFTYILDRNCIAISVMKVGKKKFYIAISNTRERESRALIFYAKQSASERNYYVINKTRHEGWKACRNLYTQVSV